jgi:hypothetical protein
MENQVHGSLQMKISEVEGSPMELFERTQPRAESLVFVLPETKTRRSQSGVKAGKEKQKKDTKKPLKE